MGYYVRSIKNKGRPWSVMYREEKQGVRKARTLRADELGIHHFSANMSLEEARKRASELNADAEIKRYAQKKLDAGERVKETKLKMSLLFSDEAEFLVWLEQKQGVLLEGTKLMSHWYCAQTVIKDLGMKPPEYSDSKLRIYRWFKDRNLSFDYCAKVLRMMNLYGKFFARHYKAFYEPVPPPRGMEKADIQNNHLEKSDRTKESEPLTPEMLDAAKVNLSSEQYNWMYLSLWLGLRPLEVDHLKEKRFYRWEITRGKPDVLWVLQTKLRGVVGDRKWKPIPLHEKEQKLCKSIIESQAFDRPLPKTIRKYVGEGCNCYAGRKGFEDLMTEQRGHDFIKVSQWMGHQSIDRTWRNYTNKKKVRY